MDSREPAAGFPAGVLREDLLHLLCRCELYPLTLLLAPAGSGKSTLLEHWRAGHARRTVVYYAVQARDNEPLRFFRRLIEHIRAQVADFDFSWFNPVAADLSPRVVGEYLAEALERIDPGLCLVLDDFQHLRDPAILDVLACLLECLPPGVRVIISSRNHPGFSLARQKLANQLLSLDQHDLRMSALEVQQLNAHLGGPQLSDGYVSSLLAMTEGWVAGVKVALLAYARFGTIALERFNGTQPEIVDYFGHVVLKGLSPSLRAFFLCSAIFEKFDGAICDHVLQRSGSALLLEELSARELFMLPVESQPGWYRYHALLHDFLSSRLAIEQPALIGPLNARAARYCLAQQEYETALLHAQRGAEPGLFEALLEQSCAAWMPNGQFAEILKWVEPLAESVLLAAPRLLVPLIGALTLSRHFHQARYYLETLRQRADQGDAVLEPLTQQFLWLNLELFQHDQAFAFDHRWQALLEPGVAGNIRAISLTIIAYHHLMDARLESAIRCARQGKALLAQAGQSFFESYADLIIALCNRNAGRATSARKDVYSDYQRTDPASPAWVNRATAMVVALYEQNQLAAAQQLCEDLMAVVNSSSATEAIATVYITLSRLLHRRQLAVRASRLLDQLSSILQLGNYGRFVSQLAQERMRQAYVGGKLAVMASLAQHYRLGARLAEGEWDSARRYDEAWERYGLATVHWLLARGARVRACRLLSVLVESVRHSEMKARALVIEANLLVARSPQLDKAAQRQELGRLVDAYGLVNISRSVFDEAPGFGAGVLGLTLADLQDVPEKYRASYAEFISGEPLEGPAGLDLSVLLTDKELQIFAFLLDGLSNTQISARTGVALSTTKWHLKNIYSKLNVSNRTEAILRVQPRTSRA
ncbi:MAG: LuxR C-terminal-related transcriptional regulator [Pseudomonas sp.]|uniref:LuxR C-terminal-related transcriptional regulator n=1 Tax=Pseudomonas sp. TaxID=306 RepID=UPI00339AC5D9